MLTTVGANRFKMAEILLLLLSLLIVSAASTTHAIKLRRETSLQRREAEPRNAIHKAIDLVEGSSKVLSQFRAELSGLPTLMGGNCSDYLRSVVDEKQGRIDQLDRDLRSEVIKHMLPVSDATNITSAEFRQIAIVALVASAVNANVLTTRGDFDGEGAMDWIQDILSGLGPIIKTGAGLLEKVTKKYFCEKDQISEKFGDILTFIEQFIPTACWFLKSIIKLPEFSSVCKSVLNILMVCFFKIMVKESSRSGLVRIAASCRVMNGTELFNLDECGPVLEELLAPLLIEVTKITPIQLNYSSYTELYAKPLLEAAVTAVNETVHLGLTNCTQ